MIIHWIQCITLHAVDIGNRPNYTPQLAHPTLPRTI